MDLAEDPRFELSCPDCDLAVTDPRVGSAVALVKSAFVAVKLQKRVKEGF